MNPLLHRVVRGGSCTSLDLATRSRPPGLFNNALLARSIVFKFPKFDAGSGAERRRADRDGPVAARDRPIETGVFIPDEPGNPMNGGYACYLGQNDADAILAELAGLRSVDRTTRDLEDIATLNIIDDLPSLDPFLLKISFDRAERPLPDRFVVLRPDEELGAVDRVVRRFSGILHEVLRDGPSNDALMSRRIPDDLWDPRTEIWSRVLAALGLRDESQHGHVVFAIRGIGFYEHLFSQTERVSTAITGYLTEVADRPRDARLVSPAYVEEVTTLRREVLRRFLERDRQCRAIFSRYDRAVDDVLTRNDPRTMQRYLSEVHELFWTLGHYVTAILNCHAILEDDLATLRPVDRIADLETLLRRLRARLLPRVPTDVRT